MYVSTSTDPIDKLGDIRTVLRTLKEAGFDAYDYSMFTSCCTSVVGKENYLELAKEIRAYADELGMVCNQSHAPFPTWLIGKEEYNAETFKKIVQAIEVTGILGGKLCVVHPCNDATPEENAAFYNSLLPYAKKAGVKIGVENMWNWPAGSPNATPAACWSAESFCAHMELLDKEWFVANLDLGHGDMMSHLGEGAEKMIYALKDRLEGLHIHDNDRRLDSHAIPYTMQMDFPAICKALKEVGYRGDVTLEIGQYRKMPLELYPSVMRFAGDVANYIRKELQK